MIARRGALLLAGAAGAAVSIASCSGGGDRIGVLAGPEALVARASVRGVSLAWSRANASERYRVLVSGASAHEPPWVIDSAGLVVPSIEITGLAPGTDYKISVRVQRGRYESRSPELTVRPLVAGTNGRVPGSTPAATWTGDAGSGLGFATAAGDVDGDGRADVLLGAYRGDYVERRLAADLDDVQRLTGPTGDNYFGVSIAVGDVNGDELGDLVIGSSRFDTNGCSSDQFHGRAELFHSSGGSLVPSGWTAVGEGCGLLGLGRVVAIAGRFDDDPYEEIAIAFPSRDGDRGRVSIFRGGPSIAATPTWTVTGGQAGASLGFWFASAGDVDGDLSDDLLLGSYAHDSGIQTNKGHLWFVSGSAPVPTSQPAEIAPTWNRDGSAVGAERGRTIAGGGDLNGDGLDDVVVAEGFANAVGGTAGTGTRAGKIYVYYGDDGGSSCAPLCDSAWVTGGPNGSRFGNALAIGDLNGDAFADLAVGIPGPEGANGGRVDVFLGGPGAPFRSGFPPEPDLAITGPPDSANFGESIAIGDVDGDGSSDLVVGAPASASNAGRAYLLYGAPPRGPRLRTDPLPAGKAGDSYAPPPLLVAESSAGRPYSCEWEWGDGETDEAEGCPGEFAPPPHRYAPGAYVLRFRIVSGTDVVTEGVYQVRIE